MGTPRVVMYAVEGCSYCSRARALLVEKGVAFEEIDVEAVPGAREEMIARSGGCASVPQIFIGDRHIGGSRELCARDAARGPDPPPKKAEAFEVMEHTQSPTKQPGP